MKINSKGALVEAPLLFYKISGLPAQLHQFLYLRLGKGRVEKIYIINAPARC